MKEDHNLIIRLKECLLSGNANLALKLNNEITYSNDFDTDKKLQSGLITSEALIIVGDYKEAKSLLYYSLNKISNTLSSQTKYNEHRVYGAALDTIINTYLGKTEDYKAALGEFERLCQYVLPNKVSFYYQKIESARIIDYYKRKSNEQQFPSEDEINEEFTKISGCSENELLIYYASSLPIDLRLLLKSGEKPLLNQTSIYLLPTTDEKKLSKQEEISVGKKIKKALITTAFSKICGNKNISKSIASSSLALGLVMPLFKEMGISDKIVIVGVITSICQFGVDFICNAQKEFFG